MSRKPGLLRDTGLDSDHTTPHSLTPVAAAGRIFSRCRRPSHPSGKSYLRASGEIKTPRLTGGSFSHSDRIGLREHAELYIYNEANSSPSQR